MYRVEQQEATSGKWLVIADGIQCRDRAVEQAKIPHDGPRRVRNEKDGIVWQSGDD